MFSGDDGPPAGGGVVRADVVVDAPVARPVRPDAGPAGAVPGAVVEGEVPRDEVLVGLRGAHGQGHQHVVGPARGTDEVRGS